MPKYAIDTNVYIDAFRSTDAAEELKQFLAAHLPAMYLSSIVMLELRSGARTKEKVEALDKGLFAPFEKRQRIFTPSANAFKESGRILALLAERDGVDLSRAKGSLVNDAMLAASCREQGVTLITRDADYLRLNKHLKGFRYVAPWP